MDRTALESTGTIGAKNLMRFAGPDRARAESPERWNQRVREIGVRIFEFADQAQPSVWQKAWWMERMTRMVDSDPRLRTRAFQFVDCLPALQSNEAILRHLRDYFDPRYVDLPRVATAVLAKGPLAQVRADAIGWATRRGAAAMAGRFITGFDVPSVIRTLRRLRNAGQAFTLDVLGEFITGNAQADRYAGQYHHLLDCLGPIVAEWPASPLLDRDADGPMPRLNLSVKLTSMDPHFDSIDPARSIAAACRRLRPLLLHARKAGAFVNIDMESTKYHDLTLALFKQLLLEEGLRDWPHVGIVLQAYLRRGESALDELLDWGSDRGTRFAIRLVKGAYWDAEMAAAIRNHAEPPVWTQKWESDACYERMSKTLLANADRVRPAFASHNVRSLAVVCAFAERLGLPPTAYEVQMLYGMGDPLKEAMVRMGRCVRVYCPYGELMPGMGYLIRRLLENTSNEGFLKQSFADRGARERLLADPAEVRPPSAPPPARTYRNTYPEDPMPAFRNASNTSFAVESNRQKMLGALQYVRGELGPQYPLIINGQPIATEEWFSSRNPSNAAQDVGRVALATRADADRAVAAAYKAFARWRTTRAAERAALLRKLADRLEMRRFELAATMIIEVGKPWREADADVSEAIDHCRYYAEQVEWIESRPRLRNVPGETNVLSYRPKGVCAVISPWAFPLAILTGMTTAPLAAGDTVVMKPARQASVVAAKLVEIMHDVGFPAGVVNFLPGAGEDVGRHLVEHGDVALVAFTGSAAVGTQVIEAGNRVRPGQGFIRKMIVEMGGKNAIIVDDDADLDAAVGAIMESAFAFAGQKCSSCSRVIALQDIHGAICTRLKEAVESAIVGPADAPSTTVGPVIDAAARERILEYVAVGRKEGRLLVQGELPAECADGYYVPPTVFADLPPSGRVAQEEIFGPVLGVLKAADFDQALVLANGTRYALTGGLFSRSPARIDQARREFAVGNLYINRRITGSQVDAQPFGGFKLSGTGVKAGSPDYLLHFMDAACITENTLRSGLVPQEQSAEGFGTPSR